MSTLCEHGAKGKRGRKGWKEEEEEGKQWSLLVGVTDNLMKMTLLYITLCAN